LSEGQIHFADFVKEYRALISQLKLAEFFSQPREAPFS
jgi:hypothetical protein